MNTEDEDEAWKDLQEQEIEETNSAYDLFKGLIGHFGSSGEGQWSQDCGEKFAEGMAEKRRQGRL